MSLPVPPLAALPAKPLVMVSPVDIAIIVIYFLFVVDIGVYLKKFTRPGKTFSWRAGK